VWPSSGRFTIVFSGGMDTAVKVNSTCSGNYWGIIKVVFNARSQLLDHIFCICQILEKKWEYSEAVHKLFVDIMEACDLVRREVFY